MLRSLNKQYVIDRNLSRLVGLWLAEGSNNSKSEITFTNSQPELVRFFHRHLKRHVVIENKPRLYGYRKDEKSEITMPVDGIAHRFYFHKRARRPYFIYRVSGVRMVSEWMDIVNRVKRDPRNYRFILQGFFAGEGNIKHIEKSHNRVLRISQGRPNSLVEKMLESLNIKFSYEPSERAYVISGRENLEKLTDAKISALHPVKLADFRNMMESYKQRHLKKGSLKGVVLSCLKCPATTHQISKSLDKSDSRICRVLSKMKKEGKVMNFRSGSRDYWTISGSTIVISKRKAGILRLLDEPKRVYEISSSLQIAWKGAFRRLKELERLNLVKQENGLWSKKSTDKEVMVL